MPDHVHLVVIGRSATSELPLLQARIWPTALAGELL
jgi:hypothetical protein